MFVAVTIAPEPVRPSPEVYRACRRIHGVIFQGVKALVVTFAVGSSAALVLPHPSLPWVGV